MLRKNSKKNNLKDLLKNSSSHKARQFALTGKTDEHIKVATKLQKDVLK